MIIMKEFIGFYRLRLILMAYLKGGQDFVEYIELMVTFMRVQCIIVFSAFGPSADDQCRVGNLVQSRDSTKL
jgi:hypothetical protein